MLFGTVALVLGKTIAGIAVVELIHEHVTECFGDDGRRRNDRDQRVAVHNGFLARGRWPARRALPEQRLGIVWLPSMSNPLGRTFNTLAAWHMALSVACKILMRSISGGQTTPSPQASATAPISAARPSRRVGDNTLESARPGITAPSGKITAAATTGPARQPRPASSIPATAETGMPGNQSPGFAEGHRSSSSCTDTDFLRPAIHSP